MDDTDAINAAHREAMRKLKAERDAMMREMQEGGGLLLVHTGDGKGKSTAAFGVMARALGWGWRVGVVQFIKGNWVTGERRFFDRFPDQVTWRVMGEGFTWDTQDRARDIAAAEAAWTVATAMLADPALPLVVLDELNIAVHYGYLPVERVVDDLLRRPADKHVIVTGRGAKPELLAAADLVSEIAAVRHPFDAGFKAQKGIDF